MFRTLKLRGMPKERMSSVAIAFRAPERDTMATREAAPKTIPERVNSERSG